MELNGKLLADESKGKWAKMPDAMMRIIAIDTLLNKVQCMNIIIREANTKVIKITDDSGITRYNLITKRGTVYELYPNRHNKHRFFVIRPNRRQAVCKFRGIKWFTDKNGFLEELA